MTQILYFFWQGFSEVVPVAPPITSRPFYRPGSIGVADSLRRTVGVADALRGRAPATADTLRSGADEQVQ